MALTPIPLSANVRHLTPAGPVPVASGMAEVTHRITSGLPSSFQLGAGFDAVLVAAGGLARHWMQMEPDRIVSEATRIGPDGATALRLLLRNDGKLVTSVALARGPQMNVGGPAGPRLAVQILGWRIHAGTILKPGDFGSYVRLAWVHLGLGSMGRFDAPKARTSVLHRLAATPSDTLPDDPNLALGLGHPRDSAPGTGSGRWVGYGWEDRDG